MKLDNIDLRLIEALQEDGRAANIDVAKRIGVGEATIRRRLAALLRDGIIRLRAIPDPLKLGLKYITIMGLQVKIDQLDNVAKKLARNEHVYYLALTAGHFDIVLIALLHEPESLARFIRAEIASNTGVLRTESFMSMGVVKSPWADPLDLARLLGNPDTIA